MKRGSSQLIALTIIVLLSACEGENTPLKKLRKINYRKLFERVKKEKDSSRLIADTTNIFDGSDFDPKKDSVSKILAVIEKDLKEDSVQIKKMGLPDMAILEKLVKSDTVVTDTTFSSIAPMDTFTNDIKKITQSEIKSLKYNLGQIKNRKPKPTDSISKKNQINARVWASISKKKQLMQLYIDGELVDSFKVSTGDKQHETPAFDLKPSGPIFNKYTSKKFPGGNYNGLGNMPYVVFVKGGYAIHGTTKGNIPKLGKKASHGCVRLHPDNAKIFNELVKTVGIENTWVTITEQ